MLIFCLVVSVLASATGQDATCSSGIRQCQDKKSAQEDNLATNIEIYHCIDILECPDEKDVQEQTLGFIQQSIDGYKTKGRCFAEIIACKEVYYDNMDRSEESLSMYHKCVKLNATCISDVEKNIQNGTLVVIDRLPRETAKPESEDSCVDGIAKCEAIYSNSSFSVGDTKVYYGCVAGLSCPEGEEKDQQTRTLQSIEDYIETMESCDYGLDRCAENYRNRGLSDEALRAYLTCAEDVDCTKNQNEIERKNLVIGSIKSVLGLGVPTATQTPPSFGVALASGWMETTLTLMLSLLLLRP